MIIRIKFRLLVLGLALAFLTFSSPAHAQTFNSGSDGSDGELTLTTPGTYLFDPDDVALFGRVLDLDRDNIYHFTTVTIAAGVTLKFRSNKVNGAAFWLAQQTVAIAGTLDLNGENGHPAGMLRSMRVPSLPGSGGYPGGVGRSGSSLQQDGFGPGGGTLFPGNANCGAIGRGGSFSGSNNFITPLVGGSGGSGSPYANDGGGGAGGGAILIAASQSITITGSITANGGGRASQAVYAGGGSGGAIRLVAPSVGGNGALRVSGVSGIADPCSGSFAASGGGIIRIEAFSQTYNGSTTGTVLRATPFGVFLPQGTPSIRVTSIAGMPVNSTPAGNFDIPDVTISSSIAVPIVIEAHRIPLGTPAILRIFSENGPDQIVNAGPLSGTVETSGVTIHVTLTPGFSRGLVHAKWTAP